MKKKYIVFIAVIVITLIVIIVLGKTTTKSENTIIDTTVNRGKFEVIVTVTGELQARNSVKIEG